MESSFDNSVLPGDPLSQPLAQELSFSYPQVECSALTNSDAFEVRLINPPLLGNFAPSLGNSPLSKNNPSKDFDNWMHNQLEVVREQERGNLTSLNDQPSPGLAQLLSTLPSKTERAFEITHLPIFANLSRTPKDPPSLKPFTIADLSEFEASSPENKSTPSVEAPQPKSRTRTPLKNQLDLSLRLERVKERSRQLLQRCRFKPAQTENSNRFISATARSKSPFDQSESLVSNSSLLYSSRIHTSYGFSIKSSNAYSQTHRSLLKKTLPSSRHPPAGRISHTPLSRVALRPKNNSIVQESLVKSSEKNANVRDTLQEDLVQALKAISLPSKPDLISYSLTSEQVFQILQEMGFLGRKELSSDQRLARLISHTLINADTGRASAQSLLIFLLAIFGISSDDFFKDHEEMKLSKEDIDLTQKSFCSLRANYLQRLEKNLSAQEQKRISLSKPRKASLKPQILSNDSRRPPLRPTLGNSHHRENRQVDRTPKLSKPVSHWIKLDIQIDENSVERLFIEAKNVSEAMRQIRGIKEKHGLDGRQEDRLREIVETQILEAKTSLQRSF